MDQPVVSKAARRRCHSTSSRCCARPGGGAAPPPDHRLVGRREGGGAVVGNPVNQLGALESAPIGEVGDEILVARGPGQRLGRVGGAAGNGAATRGGPTARRPKIGREWVIGGEYAG